MKRIVKGRETTSLSKFRKKNATLDWNEFRNYSNGSVYNELKIRKIELQHSICAYCEMQLPLDLSRVRIEHFLDKSDYKESVYDWANLLAVCFGGSSDEGLAGSMHLHCDAYKEYVKTNMPRNYDLTKLIRPFDIHPRGSYLIIDKTDGTIKPNPIYCRNKKYKNTALFSAIEYTIEILNLNNHRLSTHRKELIRFYEKKRAEAKRMNSESPISKLTESWFDLDRLKFFTTKRLILGKYAERFLSNQTKIPY